MKNNLLLKKYINFTAALVTGAVLFSSTSYSADWSAGIGVGPNFSLIDSEADLLKSSYGLSAWLTRKWGYDQRLDIALNYLNFAGANQYYPAVSLGYGVDLMKGSTYKPFIVAGPGIGTANNFPEADSSVKTSPHLFVRGGFENLWGSGEKFRIGLMFDYMHVFMNDTNISSAQLGLPLLTFNWDIWREDEKSQSFVKELPTKVEVKVEIKELQVEFNVAKYKVREPYMQTIEEFGNFMKQNASIKVRIEGHTDSIGDRNYNKQLSENRAKAVKDVLVQKWGIDAERIETAGFGPDKPVATNKTREGRQKNRRVLAVILN